MKNFEEILGKTFGNLKVISYKGKTDAGHHLLEAECSCGNLHVVIWNNLRRGTTKTCVPCATRLRSERATKFDVKTNKAEYKSYRAMINRCLDEGHPSYQNYGEKGVEICPEWLPSNNGFLVFLEQMGKRPEGTTLDRIDNSKGYCAENCRWADGSTQSHNKGKRSDAVTSKFIGVSLAKNGWRMQLLHQNGKVDKTYLTEEEAAIAYDNHSEDFYGDRPNGTARSEVKQKTHKRGGVTFDERRGKWRIRITLPDGKRVSLGYSLTEEEANAKLLEEVRKHYNE